MTDYSWQYRSRPGTLQWMFPPFAGAVRVLILTCAGVFLFQVLIGMAGFDPEATFDRTFGLVPFEVLTGLKIWQLATYLFLHGGFTHLLFNMLGLWFFGSALEQEWGRRRFLGYYFLTGVGGGVFVVVMPLLLSARAAIEAAHTPTVGASGAILGLLLAYGVLHPNRPIFIYGIFPIKAKWLVIAVGVMTVLGSLGASGGGISYSAHLGGMVVGYAYLKRVWRVGELYREVRWRLRRRRFRVIPRDRGNGDTRFPFH